MDVPGPSQLTGEQQLTVAALQEKHRQNPTTLYLPTSHVGRVGLLWFQDYPAGDSARITKAFEGNKFACNVLFGKKLTVRIPPPPPHPPSSP